MSKIVCDKCGHEQGFSPITSKMAHGVERVYIRCSNCKEEYTAYYTDKEMRKIQARQRRLGRMLGNRQGKRYDALWDEYQNNKQLFTIKEYELKKLMEGSDTPGVKPLG